MNVLYRKLKAQIKSDEYYAGNGILAGLLKIIKLATLLVLHPEESQVESENQADEDFFSQHVYRMTEMAKMQEQHRQPSVSTPIKLEESIVKEVEKVSPTQNSDETDHKAVSQVLIVEQDNPVNFENDSREKILVDTKETTNLMFTKGRF